MAQRAWLLAAVSVLVSLAVGGGLWLGFGSGGGTADGYGLSSWGDDCAGTPATSARCSLTMDADKTVSATFAVAESEPLSLIVVSDGSHDSLLLEWTGGPANATKWQYRRTQWNQEKHRLDPWGSWTDISGSGATTKSYHLTNLSSRTGHAFEVRAVVGRTASQASNKADGITHGAGRYPRMSPEQIVEGDGRTEWRLHALGFVITIPDGVRMEAGYGGVASDGEAGVPVSVYAGVPNTYVGGLLFSRAGQVLASYVEPQLETRDSAAAGTSAGGVRVLLDEIIASLRHLD